MHLTKAITEIDQLLAQLESPEQQGLSVVEAADLQVPENGPPTAAELRLINQFVPRGMEPLKTEDCYMVTAAIFDNLINRNLFRFEPETLKTLARLSFGIPTTFDHDRFNASIVWGRAISSKIVHVDGDKIPIKFLRGDNVKENREILRSEGYHRLYSRCFMNAKNTELIESMRYAQLGPVSPGGFRHHTVKCGLCNIPYRQTVDGHKCTHYPPYYRRDLNDQNEAPFSIIGDIYDLWEWSFVTVPAQILAGVV